MFRMIWIQKEQRHMGQDCFHTNGIKQQSMWNISETLEIY